MLIYLYIYLYSRPAYQSIAILEFDLVYSIFCTSISLPIIIITFNIITYKTLTSEIDGLGETIRDHNRSLHNLQEVLREAITSRDTASRDRPRDVIIQPRETDSTTNSEIREIQKTLLELQVRAAR